MTLKGGLRSKKKGNNDQIKILDNWKAELTDRDAAAAVPFGKQRSKRSKPYYGAADDSVMIDTDLSSIRIS